MIWLLIAAALLIGIGGANWLVDRDNAQAVTAGRLWPPLATVAGVALFLAAIG